MTLMLRLAITWIAFLGLWLVFAFQVTVSELIVGGVASAMAAAFGWITFRVAPPCFEPRFRWLVQMWRLAPMIPIDLWLLLKHLIRQIAGKPSRSSSRSQASRRLAAIAMRRHNGHLRFYLSARHRIRLFST